MEKNVLVTFDKMIFFLTFILLCKSVISGYSRKLLAVYDVRKGTDINFMGLK